MDKLLLRPADALGIGRSQVYALLAAGTLPSIRVGGRVRIPLDALRRWIEAASTAPEGSNVDTPAGG